MISVILPTYRNPKYLDLCLKSCVSEISSTEDAEVIVVVDGFLEESSEVLDKYQTNRHVKILEFPENMGMQSAINYGVMNAESEYVFVINDDNVFDRGWAHSLSETIQTFDDDKWVLTVDQIEASPSMFGFHTSAFGEVDKFNLLMFYSYCEKINEWNITSDGNIFPFVVSKKNFMTVGGFDIFYQSPFVCDWDFFLKLELLGLKHYRTHCTHMYHFGSTATKFGKDALKFRESERIAWEQFDYKWGFPPSNGHNNSKLPYDSRNIARTIKGVTFR